MGLGRGGVSALRNSGRPFDSKVVKTETRRETQHEQGQNRQVSDECESVISVIISPCCLLVESQLIGGNFSD